MDLKKPLFQRAARLISFVCGSLFCIFSFLYLWKVQGSVLGMAQHILSGGLTVYNPFVGAFLITLGLFAIQRVVNVLCNLQREWHCLSYFPSFLLLSFITSVHATVYDGLKLGLWVFLFPLGILLFALCVPVCKHKYHDFDTRDGAIFERILLPNLLQFLIMAAFCLAVSNTDETLHNKVKLEYLLSQKEYDEALKVGRKSQSTTQEMCAYRAYALYKKGELGNHLFDYPQPYASQGLLLNMKDTLRSIFSPLNLYRELGAYPRYHGEPAREFLELLEVSDKAKHPMTDQYILCAYLLDRKLDDFANKLGEVYQLNDSVVDLPLFYQQALIMYLRQKPGRYTYRNSVIETNYRDYLKNVRSIGSSVASRNKNRRDFGTTYWWYYDTAVAKNIN